MNSIPLYLASGIVFISSLALARGASAQTVSLFQQLSVPAYEFSTLHGQESVSKFSFPPTTQELREAYCRLRIPSEPRLQGHLFERSGRYTLRRIGSDYRHFYAWDTALNYSVALGGAAILANTPLDRHISEWYQTDLRSSGTRGFSKFWKFFGEGQLWGPIFAVSAISYRFYEQSDWNQRNERCFFGEYTARTVRGYLTGLPALGVLQSLLGAGRPHTGGRRGSYWRPFNADNAVSGHSYIGAVPFITAAQMVEKPWLKGLFYTCSLLPAWSRVNDNAHYLSQSALGWYLAYLSVRAVSQTEGTKLPKGLTIFPIAEGRYVGLGFLYKR